jgi:hypothetical protein
MRECFSLSLKGEGRGEGMGLHETAASGQSSDALTLPLSQRERE